MHQSCLEFLTTRHFSELHILDRKGAHASDHHSLATPVDACGTNVTPHFCSTTLWTMSCYGCYGVWVSHGLPTSLLGPKGIGGAISHYSHEAFLPGNAQRSGQPNAIVDAQHHAPALHDPGTSHQLLSREAGIVASIPTKEPTV